MSDYTHGCRYGFSITFITSAFFGATGDLFRGSASIRWGDPGGIWHYHADNVPVSLAWGGYAMMILVGLIVYLLHPLCRRFDKYPNQEDPRVTPEFMDGYRCYCVLGAVVPALVYGLSFCWANRSTCSGPEYLAWHLLPILIVFAFDMARLKQWVRKPK